MKKLENLNKTRIERGSYVLVDPLNLDEDKRGDSIVLINAPNKNGVYYCYTRELTTERVDAVNARDKSSAQVGIFPASSANGLKKGDYLLLKLDRDGDIMQISARNDPSGECSIDERNTGTVSIADQYHIEGVLSGSEETCRNRTCRKNKEKYAV